MDWDELQSACAACRRCGLADARHNVVFGVGNREAEVMLVGEGPGEQEDLKGEPFVGRAGKLLDDMLEMIYLDRSKVYICNIVKCRPPMNRDPLNTEQDECSVWLKAQMELVRPRIVVCLGRIAASALIDPEFKITRQHGQWFEKDGVKYMAVYHPAALLRDESKRPETFVDLKNLSREIKVSCQKTY
jgi:uracil-DNA glycosylase family 4